jgi:hypothetical protein
LLIGLDKSSPYKIIILKLDLINRKITTIPTSKYEQWVGDTASGYPTRGILESLGLGYVADELEKKGRLGKA